MFEYGDITRDMDYELYTKQNIRKTRTECPKLVPGAGILPTKFQLEVRSRLIISSIDELILIVINYIVSLLYPEY